ncbi:MAG: hypothetical protein WEB52_07320 [Dehalococcoidia bacterium]
MLRVLLKFALISAVVVSALVVVLIILNGRDPYGGPIEPSAPH